MTPEILSLVMAACTVALLMAGFPVAFTLAGGSLAFAFLGGALDLFDLRLLGSLPSRIFGVMTNQVLVAIPLFVFMGSLLERSRMGEELLEALSGILGPWRGGLGYSVTLVGMVLAATTGIVGATVVMMGMISLPSMLRAGYDPRLSAGAIAAAGTLGQIIPPSIALVILGDVMQSAHSQAQLALGNFAPDPVSVVDLFAAAILPGLLLVALYLAYQATIATFLPSHAPPRADAHRAGPRELLTSLAAPALLILAVLGSILLGLATPTESAGVGAAGMILLAFLRARLSVQAMRDAARRTVRMSSMIYTIIIGASVFSLVFRGLEGDRFVTDLIAAGSQEPTRALFGMMALVFVLGFFLDFIEIVVVVVPIIGPGLLMMGIDPIWLGVLIALNLQTSFLTPPFGPSLFYLRSVAPPEVGTLTIYRGVAPFVVLQLIALALVWLVPSLATWLPRQLFG